MAAPRSPPLCWLLAVLVLGPDAGVMWLVLAFVLLYIYIYISAIFLTMIAKA